METNALDHIDNLLFGLCKRDSLSAGQRPAAITTEDNNA
jgi:hypothetical protein